MNKIKLKLHYYKRKILLLFKRCDSSLTKTVLVLQDIC